MSVTLVTFSVDDTSPCVSYSPFGDTFSTPNLIAGWNPYFDPSGYAKSQGEVGNGTSLHITSLDGASLGLQWSGTGITLMGNATQATYSITLDNQLLSDTNGSAANNVLANVQGLNDTLHTIRLTAQIPESQNPPTSSMLVFDQAILFSSPLPVADNIGFQNQTLNDQQIAFLGSWSITSPVPGGPNFHSTHTVGDRAIANFSGTTLILLGQTSPSGGNFSVLLDNTTTTTLSARSSFTQSSSLLFFATDLDPATPHSIQVENLDGSELALLVGGFNAIVPYPIPPSSTNTTMSAPSASTTSSSGAISASNAFPEGTIAAFALAGILASIFICGALYFFCVHRPRQRRRRRRRSAGSFYAPGMERQILSFHPPRGGPKAQEAGGAPAGVSGLVGAGGRRGLGGGGGRGEADEADVLDISTGFDKSMDLDLEDAGRSPIERSEDGGRRGSGTRWSLLTDFQRWRRAAVRGSLGGVSLGIRFRSASDSDNEKAAATTASPTSPQTGAGANTQTQTNADSATRAGFLDTGRPVSSTTSLPSSGSTAQRERAKRKGKMRAVSGRRSWSPSFMLDLPVWLGGRHTQTHAQAQRQTQRLSEMRAQYMADAEHDIYTSFPVGDADAALYAAQVEGRGRGNARVATEHPPSYAASVSLSNSNRDSIRDSHSDPSFLVPSGPRSVSSNSPVFHGTDMLQQRRDSDSQNLRPGDSRHFLLNDAEGNGRQDVPVSMASPQTGQTQANITDSLPSSGVRPLPSVAQHKRQQQQQQQRHIYGQISTGPSPLSRKIMDPRLIETSLETTEDNPSIEEPRMMREVLRSLSPRTSRLLPIPPPPPRRAQPLPELVIAPTPASQAPAGVQSPASGEALSPEAITSAARRLLPLVESGHESRWMESVPSGGGRTVKALPRTPTSDDDDQGERVGLHESAFLNYPETSPFRVNFDVGSTRTSIRPLPPTARSPSDIESPTNNYHAGGGMSSDESTSDPQYYTTAAESNYKPARNTFGASESEHAGGSRLSDFMQGASSSRPFRLPSISVTDPHEGLEDGNATSSHDGPSPAGSEGVVSFIDFTSSPEGSLRVPSEKSSSKKKKAKQGRRRSLPVPPLIVDEPMSRWSTTTAATNPQADNGGGEIGHSNESSGESQPPISPLSEHRLTNSSMFPISVMVDIPGSAQPENSQRSSAFTQSDNLHIHPTLENIESPTESLPVSTSEIRFRHSDEESPESRRPPGHSFSEAHEQQPDASTDEYRPPPFDPNILVSRVLGMSSPTSSVTARPPHRSQSNIALSSATNSIFPLSSRHESSNDQLNSRPGQS